MEIVTIPEFFDPSNQQRLQVFDYRSDRVLQKQKVNLGLHTISFLLEGTKEVYMGDHSIAIEASHFLMMKAGHCLMTERLSSAHQKYRSVLLFFSDEVLREMARKHFEPDKGKAPARYVEAVPYDDYLRTFVESLLHIPRFDAASQAQLLYVKLDELLLYLRKRGGTGLMQFLHGATDDRQQQFIKVVENNRMNRLSLGELAHLSNMSISSFKREFLRQYGMAPSKWFQQKRLEHAAFLLERQGKRPSEIFEEVGYESLSNFIQAFKNRYGVTPKKFQGTAN